MSDEGFREIQLNGKQLVFLFMAATVVSVVIFLCGVLVGRGVRGTASAGMMSTEVGPDPGLMAAPEMATPPAATSAQSGTPAAAGAAAPPAEELSYAERLLRDAPPEEHLKETPAAPATPPPAPAPAVQEPVAAEPPARRAAPPAPAARTAATPAPEQVAQSTPTDPSGPGFAVQVAAFRDRGEADTLVKQLTAKGYPAFVIDPVKGAPTAFFRVRVGKFKTLKDAEAISAKLQTAEQFTKAWIVR